MLTNYFKIAIAVLRRRKFFTFISLFGISFTLTILMVATAFFDNVTGPGYPDVNRNRSLYINAIKQVNTEKGYTSSGPASFYFLDHYAGSMKTPEKIAISSLFKGTNAYINNKKLSINIKYSNAAFWEVLQFQFLEGKPYSQQQIANGELVAVITEETKKDYFGDVPSVVGKYLEADNVKYRVCGVVKNVPVTMLFAYGDMYLPYTVSKNDYRNKGNMGEYSAIILAKSESDLPRITAEYNTIMAKVQPDNKDFTKVYSFADPYFATFTRQFFGDDKSSGVVFFSMVVSIITLLFMLLPTLNLVNINISRIMERSSEIGVRKAFGASSKTLVGQFIVENMILTFIGGIIGVLLSFVILQLINSSDMIPHAVLSMNLSVLLYGLLACVFFGLLSGVYPAWRMSRLQVTTALKAQ
jgi:putative ABC transport system permease protein